MKPRIHDAKIHLATYRANIPHRDEPRWRSMGDGKALGFRKRQPDDTGTWVARWTTNELQDGINPRRKTVQKVLGRVHDTDFDEAETLAKEWFKQCKGGVTKSGTVEDAFKYYVENQRQESGDSAANASDKRFKYYLKGTAFGRTKLDDLTMQEIEKWRNSLVTPTCQKRSANRIFRTWKAAMNFAFTRNMCASDAAWRKVKPFKGAGAKDQQRTAHLSLSQRKALLAECGPDLCNLIRASLYSSARVGELQKAKRRDFDAKQGMLRFVSVKGKGEERERHVPLSTRGIAFFKEIAKDKLPEAPLLTFGGERWRRDEWADGIRQAVKTANEKLTSEAQLPADTVMYTMRHCAITDMLSAGINVSAVAKIAGTSIKMIEDHYYKFIATDVSDKLAAITAF